MEQKYLNYSLTNFLEDIEFRQWVKNPTAENEQFFENLQAKFPEKRELIAQARLLILAYNIESTSEATTERAWHQLKRQQMSVSTKSEFVFTMSLRQKYSIAASLTILMLVSLLAWYRFFTFKPIIYQTQYGQMQTVTLPDGSKVTLNGNSRLEIGKEWTDDNVREINLVGEAFFEVIKKPATQQKFVVNTKDLAVIVLGTSFNVSDRNVKTRVVLKEGAVTLKLKNENQTNENQEVVMKVGELVEFSKKSRKFTKQTVNTDNFSSWKDKKLIFEDTAMREIATLIQETYGLEVRFQDEKMSKRKISGTIPSENLTILLTSLETIFDVKITQEDQQLIFESQH
jgi:ferric-dicitrate binding protein FerR (iron transport regulator)